MDPNTLNLPIWIGIQVFVITYEIILKKEKIISFKNIFLTIGKEIILLEEMFSL